MRLEYKLVGVKRVCSTIHQCKPTYQMCGWGLTNHWTGILNLLLHTGMQLT